MPKPSDTDRATAPCILVVEDDQVLLHALTTELETLGYSVIATSSADAAMVLIEDGLEFEALITDIAFPGKVNGIELVRHLSNQGHHPPTLILSGQPVGALDLGPLPHVRVLRKPCATPALERAIKDMLPARGP